MNVIVPRLECAEVWEGNTKLVKQLETVQMAAAKKVLRRCSSTTSITALRAELAMYPLRTNRRVRKLKMANIKEEHAEKEVASHS